MSVSSGAGHYATAGAAYANDVHFHVSDHAFLPDSDVGTDLEKCYRSKGVRAEHRRERRTLPLPLAVLGLIVLTAVCLIMVLTRVYRVTLADAQIAGMRSSMEAVRERNVQLAQEVAQARDLSRIGYIAVHDLGMVAGDGDRVIQIYVPEIERFSGTVTVTAEQEQSPEIQGEDQQLLTGSNRQK